MSLSSLLTPEVVLRDYFHAKDENRPYLLDRVFTSDASLHINNSCSKQRRLANSRRHWLSWIPLFSIRRYAIGL